MEEEEIKMRGPEFDQGDLARLIQELDGLPTATTLNLLDHIAARLPQILSTHRRIEILGIGVFTLGPKFKKVDGEFLQVPGKDKIRFKAAEDLKRAVGIE